MNTKAILRADDDDEDCTHTRDMQGKRLDTWNEH